MWNNRWMPDVIIYFWPRSKWQVSENLFLLGQCTSLPDSWAPTNHPSCGELSNETQLSIRLSRAPLKQWEEPTRGDAGSRTEGFLSQLSLKSQSRWLLFCSQGGNLLSETRISPTIRQQDAITPQEADSSPRGWHRPPRDQGRPYNPRTGKSSNLPGPGMLSHDWEPIWGPDTADGHDQPWTYYVSTPNTIKI